MLLLTFFPHLRPHTDYYRREFANVTLPVEYHVSDGNLFVAMPGRIRPPAPEDDIVLETFTLKWDKHSFRIPAQTADAYPIAVFGDSFTEGFNVPLPWPDRLAELAGVPVRNYGYRGYGPREVARAAREFAAAEPRTWVLYAYFSGNDLGDAARPTIEYKPISEIVAPLLPPPDPAAAPHYDYPMPLIIGGYYYEMAFLTYYLWNHIAPPEGFAASSNFHTIGSALDTIAEAAPEDACLGLVFIPTKEQLYYPYIYETERRWVREASFASTIDETGSLALEPAPPLSASEEANFIEHLHDQRDAIAELADSKPRWHFIDLLPAFEEAVGQGALLYYPFDTHWNQEGNDLAAEVIADALRDVPGCPLDYERGTPRPSTSGQ